MRLLIQPVKPLCLLALLAIAASGCRSTGSSRWASLNPWKSADQETSLAARSAPELPTAQSQNPGGTAVAANTANSGGQAPAFTPAAAPSSPYPTTSAAVGAPPVTATAAAPSSPYPTTSQPPVAPAVSPAPPIASAPPATTAPQAGPYDPNGYTPPPTQTATAPANADRYGGSRYAPSPGLPLADVPPVTAPSTTSAPPTGDRYASAPSTGLPGLTTTPVPPITSTTPPVADPALPGLPPASSTPAYGPVAQASNEQVTLPNSPGGYRPGGTTSYDSQVSVALRTAAPAPATSAPGTAPGTTTPPASTTVPSAYPTTAPSYR